METDAPGYTSAGFGPIVGLFKNPPHPNGRQSWFLKLDIDGKDGQKSAWKLRPRKTAQRPKPTSIITWAPELPSSPKPGPQLLFDTYGLGDYTDNRLETRRILQFEEPLLIAGRANKAVGSWPLF